VPGTTLGREALRHVPAPPRTLAELSAYRGELRAGRSLPWLDTGDERWIRTLAEYLIPMAYEEPDPRARSALRSLLRQAARARCRTGLRLGASVERRVFAHASPRGLPGAFVA